MKVKQFVFAFAFLVVVFAMLIGVKAQGEIDSIDVYLDGTQIYSASYDPATGIVTPNTLTNIVAVERGGKAEVKVVFTSGSDTDKVRVRAAIYGYRYDITDTTERFDILSGRTYTKTLYLDIPEDMGADPNENYTLYVSITDGVAFSGVPSASRDITVQRKSFKLRNLDVEIADVTGCCPTATVNLQGTPEVCGGCFEDTKAGSIIAVTAIIKNRGSQKLEDVYVTATLDTKLCVRKTEYVGDIEPFDTGDEEDTAEVTLYLLIPSDTEPGTYNLKVEAYNDDSSDETSIPVNIRKAEEPEVKTEVFIDSTKKEITKGETGTYTLTLMNLGSKGVTYTVEVTGLEGWATATIEPSAIRLAPDSSTTVKIELTPEKDAIEGEHTFTVTVKADDKIEKQYNLIADVKKPEGITVDTKIALLIAAIVLAVVIVILLVILIAKMARKGEEEEKPEETAYY